MADRRYRKATLPSTQTDPNHLAIGGEIDIYTVDQFARLLSRWSPPGAALLDLSTVSLFTAAAYRTLVGATGRYDGRLTVLVSPVVARVLAICGPDIGATVVDTASVTRFVAQKQPPIRCCQA